MLSLSTLILRIDTTLIPAAPAIASACATAVFVASSESLRRASAISCSVGVKTVEAMRSAPLASTPASKSATLSGLARKETCALPSYPSVCSARISHTSYPAHDTRVVISRSTCCPFKYASSLFDWSAAPAAPPANPCPTRSLPPTHPPPNSESASRSSHASQSALRTSAGPSHTDPQPAQIPSTTKPVALPKQVERSSGALLSRIAIQPTLYGRTR